MALLAHTSPRGPVVTVDRRVAVELSGICDIFS